VDHLLSALAEHEAAAGMPRTLLRELTNTFLDGLREGIREGRITSEDELNDQARIEDLAAFVQREGRPHFRRVINATGVVVHTNLGRSLLADEAIQAVVEADRYYSNLEFDLGSGGRGSRYSHVEDILVRLTGAEAALVVNNNASAVILVLDTLAKGKEVVVSRGQLVEIGGSFRIPDVMARSGAHLHEVGATNRTHPRDYENAVNENTGALMKVHSSNFRIIGFVRETSVEELVEIGRRHDLPVIEDLGSGNLYDFRSIGFAYEPTVQETVAAGADVTTFSGDKVLGGPQAGIIVGRKLWIDKIKKNPLNRALRIDKMTLAALEATLRLYLDPATAREKIPTLAMITASPAELKAKARSLRNRLKKSCVHILDIELKPGVSRVGGGSFPERDLETTLLELRPKNGMHADALKEALLETDPPLVGRIEDDAFCLDPRTILKEEFGLVADVVEKVVTDT
jgi:L-seryl-tRNA(Ser) seleniumtransferase